MKKTSDGQAPTEIRLEVTAYFTSKEADFEKSAAFGVTIGEGDAKDWGALVAKLIGQALTLDPDMPLTKIKRMSPKQVAKYLAQRDGDAA